MSKRSVAFYLNTFLLKIRSHYYCFRDKITTSRLSFQYSVPTDHQLQSLNAEDPAFLTFTSYHFYKEPKTVLNDLGVKSLKDLLKSRDRPGTKFNPVSILYYGLVGWNTYHIERSDNLRKELDSIFAFIKSYGEFKDSAWILPYRFDYPRFDISAPWYSGITQGLALSFLLRYKILVKDPMVDALCKDIYNSFGIEEKEGGIASTTPEGMPWIEEYPNSSCRQVLNGFLFSLISMIEYAISYNKESIVEKIAVYESSFFTTYIHYLRGSTIKYARNRCVLANVQYQGLHFYQLVHLYKLTGNQRYIELAREWKDHVNWQLFAGFYNLNKQELKREREELTS